MSASPAPGPTIDTLRRDGVPPVDLARWSEWTLTRVGFRPSNALPVMSVCRDELMLGLEDAVHAVWGPSFDASGLGALPLLGRTGMAAALGHAPGEDGRHRFVVLAFAHIGVDVDGVVGQLRRPGVHHPTSACGALVAARARLGDGPPAQGVDPDDVEMSMLLAALSEARAADPGADGPLPDLVGLTDLLRSRATHDLERLVAGLNGDGQCVDHAMLSGIVVHAPEGDRVAVREAYVVLDGERQVLPTT